MIPFKVLLVPVLISPLLQESWHQISEIDCDPTCETGCIPVEGEVDKFYRVEEKRVSRFCVQKSPLFLVKM